MELNVSFVSRVIVASRVTIHVFCSSVWSVDFFAASKSQINLPSSEISSQYFSYLFVLFYAIPYQVCNWSDAIIVKMRWAVPGGTAHLISYHTSTINHPPATDNRQSMVKYCVCCHRQFKALHLDSITALLTILNIAMNDTSEFLL